MQHTVVLAQDWQKLAMDIDKELTRARQKFPDSDFLFAALVKKVGGVAMVMVDQTREQANLPRQYSHQLPTLSAEINTNIYKKLVQVAVMAIRLAQEGETQFAYCPPERENEG